MDASRILFYKGNLDITDLTPGDTGVYTCLATWGAKKAKQNVTLGVYSLQVTANSTTLYVFENDDMRLNCHSQVLGRLFPSSKRQWTFNGLEMPDPAQAMANSKTNDVVHGINKSMAGVWECQVSHASSNRVWNTAWYKVSVENAPSWLSRAFRTTLDHWPLVTGIATITILVLVFLFAFSTYKEKKAEDETDEEFLKQKNGWTNILSEHADSGRINVDDIDQGNARAMNGEEKNLSQSESESSTSDGESSSSDWDSSSVLGNGTTEMDMAHRSDSESDSADNNMSSNKGEKNFRQYPNKSENKKMSCKHGGNYTKKRSFPKERRSSYRYQLINQRSSCEQSPVVSWTKSAAYAWLVKNSKSLRHLESRLMRLPSDEKSQFTIDLNSPQDLCNR